MRKPSPSDPACRPAFEPLEPRLLLSADPQGLLYDLNSFPGAPDYAFVSNSSFTGILYVAPTGAPYKTIQSAVNAALPGNEIIVADGTYTESVSISTPNLTIRSANKYGAKVVAQPYFGYGSGFALLEGANYITIDGFDISAPFKEGSGVDANKTGINHVLNHHTIVENCVVHDCGSAGIALDHGDYRYIENNVVYNTSTGSVWSASAISLWQCIAFDQLPGFHNVISGNVAYNNYDPAGGSDGNGIIIDDLRNTQSGSTNGVYPDSTLVENNLVYNNGAKGIVVWLSEHVVVRNNTAWHNNWDNTNATTARGELSLGNSDDVQFYNNVAVADSSVNANNTAMLDFTNNTTLYKNVGAQWLDNLFYDSANPSATSVKISFSPTNLATVLANNIVESDPKFIAPGVGSSADFRLSPGSPAINSAYAAQAPVDDLLGKVRDSLPDVGAYEFGATSFLPDANGDRNVDGADLALWQQNYDPAGIHAAFNSVSTGDWNADGKVDGADLALWQQYYNPTGYLSVLPPDSTASAPDASDVVSAASAVHCPLPMDNRPLPIDVLPQPLPLDGGRLAPNAVRGRPDVIGTGGGVVVAPSTHAPTDSSIISDASLALVSAPAQPDQPLSTTPAPGASIVPSQSPEPLALLVHPDRHRHPRLFTALPAWTFASDELPLAQSVPSDLSSLAPPPRAFRASPVLSSHHRYSSHGHTPSTLTLPSNADLVDLLALTSPA